jgi:hypothetical protein
VAFENILRADREAFWKPRGTTHTQHSTVLARASSVRSLCEEIVTYPRL